MPALAPLPPVISWRNSSAFSRLEEKPAPTRAPCAARARLIAAPMPRVPPVTSATRPSSLRGPVPAAGGAWVSVGALMRSPIRRPCASASGALLQPLRDVRPDLLAGAGAGHQADVADLAVEVRDVLGRHNVEQRQGPRPRRDVVGACGH